MEDDVRGEKPLTLTLTLTLSRNARNGGEVTRNLGRRNEFAMDISWFLSFCSFLIASFGAAILLLSKKSSHGILILCTYLFFAIESWFGFKYQLGSKMRTILKSDEIYSDRRQIQSCLVIVVTLATLSLLVALTISKKSNLEKFCIAITSIVVGLFLVESISLHAIDSVMYYRFGAVNTLCCLWLLLCGSFFLASCTTLRKGKTFKPIHKDTRNE